MDEEGKELVKMFQAQSQAKSRTSLPRTEKGTIKVDSHHVQEEASILLFTLTKVSEQVKDDTNRQQLMDELTKDAEKVVSDFGLDTNRLKASGEKRAIELSKDATRTQDLDDLEAECAALKAKLQSIKAGIREKHKNWYENALAERAGRITRQSGNRKRDREMSEVDASLDKMNAISKRMKTEEGSRQ